ncbi:MAG: sigma-54-dependent transcriptional regulator, partial [Desulfohalobiaceae bacterium]
MANILIIDDDPQMAYSLARAAKMHGHEIETAGSLGEARKHLERGQGHDLVFLDVRLPDGSGLDFLSSLRTAGSQPSIIVLTGYGEPEGAEKAITKGAWDYIEKTSSIDQIALSMCRALEHRSRRLEQKTTLLKRSRIIGDSPVIQEALEQVGLAAATDTSVLVTGETGTDKELFSRAIHANSPRSVAPFVVVDCGSIRDTLAESILFGHAKGAFTGAHQSTQGLIAKAEGGTLFLDEVGELPLEIQKSLLRVLEDHTFRPIGSTVESRVDFRIVAATNQDLSAMVQKGSFREDL